MIVRAARVVVVWRPLVALSLLATMTSVVLTSSPAAASHSVACRADLPVHAGEPMTWRALVAGGSGSFSFSWAGNDGLQGNGSVVTATYPSEGFKTATVVVTDTVAGDVVTSAECGMHVMPATFSEPPNVTPVLWVPRGVEPSPWLPQARRVWRSIHAGYFHLYGKTFRMNPMRTIVSPLSEVDLCGGDCDRRGMNGTLVGQAWNEASAAVGGVIPYTRAIMVLAWGGGGFAGAYGWDVAQGAAGDWAIADMLGILAPDVQNDTPGVFRSDLGYHRAVDLTASHELNHVIGWDDPHDFDLLVPPTDYEKAVSLAGPFLTETLADVTRPTVKLTAPADGATAAGTVMVSATATDGTAMDAVAFLVDEELLAVDGSRPYAVPFDTTLVGFGPHRLRAIAYDAQGNTATTPATTIDVRNQLPDTSCRGLFPSGTFHACFFESAGGRYLGTLVEHPFPALARNAAWGINHAFDDGEIAFGRTEAAGTWRGTLDFPPGNYELGFFTDDGLRVRLDDRLVIDEFTAGQVAEFSTVAALSGPTRVQIDWFDGGGAAALTFWFQPASASPAFRLKVPDALDVLEGIRRSGTASSLATDDDKFFDVESTTGRTPTTSWVATFRGVPNSIRDLQAVSRTKSSSACAQTIAIWRWTTRSWVELNARTVGPSETYVGGLTPPGQPGAFVSGASGRGDVRLRIRCRSSGARFVAHADLLRLSYAG